MAARVLVTGVSGLGRSRIFDSPEVRDRMQVHEIGAEMVSVAQQNRLDYSESNILHAPGGTLSALRAAAVERIVHRITSTSRSTKPHIVSAHSIFLLTNRIVEGLRGADLEILKPDRLVTLIDGPQFIHDRLKEHEGNYFHLTVESIVRWQEFEVFLAQHIAEDLGIEHVVAPANRPNTFAELIFRSASVPTYVNHAGMTQAATAGSQPKPIVYASYPMHHLPPRLKPQVEDFKAKLRERCILFDPADVDALEGLQSYFESSDRSAIHSHTIVRDLDWFIGLNKATVVAYWPDQVFSSGMNDELKYAYETGRETYLVTESLNQRMVPALSAFTTYKSKVFGSSDEFFAFWELPSALQNAYLVIQAEALHLIRIQIETGQAADRETFRHDSWYALHNALSDRFISGEESRLACLMDEVYERWVSPFETEAMEGQTHD